MVYSVTGIVISLSFILGWGYWGLFGLVPMALLFLFSIAGFLIHKAPTYPGVGRIRIFSEVFFAIVDSTSVYIFRFIGIAIIVWAYSVSYGDWLWVIGLWFLLNGAGDVRTEIWTIAPAYMRKKSLGFFHADFEHAFKSMYIYGGGLTLIFVTPAFIIAYLSVALEWVTWLQCCIVILAVLIYDYFNTKLILRDIPNAFSPYSNEPRDDEYANSNCDLGFAHNRNGNFSNAIKEFDKAISFDSTDGEAYYGRGFAYGMLNKYENAIADFSKAIEMNQDDDTKSYSSYHKRGLAHIELGQYELAIADFSKVLELKIINPEMYFIRGSAQIELGQYELAKKDFQAALMQAKHHGYASIAKSASDALQKLGEQL